MKAYQPNTPRPVGPDFSGQFMARSIGVAILIFVAVVVLSTGTYVVQPGYRGVEVTLGAVSADIKPEGFGLKKPFITEIRPMSVRQQTRSMTAECYSSDLQQVNTELYVLFRVPERSVIKIFKDYAGEPFESLVAPRVQEALKEVAAGHNAEQIVKKREEIKQRALEVARRKVGTNLIEVVDLVLYNITLSPELGQAIEAKMVQEQEAEKAKFLQLKAQIEAETAVVRAKGEADAIQARGQALRANPDFIKLQIVQNWNGKSPLVVGSGGSTLMLPVNSLPADHFTPANRLAKSPRLAPVPPQNP
jgi:prohibitin 2